MQNQNDIQLAQAGADPGFKVPAAPSDPKAQPANPPPAPADGLSATPPPDAGSGVGAPMEIAPVPGAPAADTSTRDLAIGGAVFLILLVVFFFARNAYAHHLVKRRVAPSSADTAGWMMFFGLSFLSAAAVLAVMNSDKFLTVAITGTLFLLGVAALVGALLTGRR